MKRKGPPRFGKTKIPYLLPSWTPGVLVYYYGPAHAHGARHQ